jgi:hypothetical protein
MRGAWRRGLARFVPALAIAASAASRRVAVAEDGTLVVRVTGPDGAGVPRARASLEPDAQSGPERWIDAPVVDGKAVFAGRLGPGRVCVWGATSAAGVPLEFAPVALQVPDDRRAAGVQMGVGGRMTGHVVDEAGKPVAGVHVRATGSTPEWCIRDLPHSEATTDAKGEFRFFGLANLEYTLDATETGAFAHPPSGHAHPAWNGVSMVLKKETPVRLLVLDFAGKPVPAARVEVSRLRGREFHKPEPLPDGLTGPDGSVTLSGIDSRAQCQLVVNPPEARPDLLQLLLWTWPPADQTIRLERSFTLRGKVTDARGKGIVADVRLRAHVTGGLWTTRPSKADGSFEIRQLPYVPVDVAAFRDRDAPWEGPTTWQLVVPGGPAPTLVVQGP